MDVDETPRESEAGEPARSAAQTETPADSATHAPDESPDDGSPDVTPPDDAPHAPPDQADDEENALPPPPGAGLDTMDATMDGELAGAPELDDAGADSERLAEPALDTGAPAPGDHDMPPDAVSTHDDPVADAGSDSGADDPDEADGEEPVETTQVLDEIEPIESVDETIDVLDDDMELDLVDAGPPAVPPVPRPAPPVPRTAPPPPPSAMPPVPRPAPPPPRPAALRDDAGDAATADSGHLSSGGLVLPPALAAGPAVEPPAPVIESPSVLDRELANQEVWPGRAAYLAGQVDDAADPDAAGALAYELGELRERRLGDADGAGAAYDRARELDPSLRANLWAMRRLLAARERWAELCDIIDAEIDYAQDDEERADLYVEKARILEDRLDRPDEARAAYEHALDLVDPEAHGRAEIEALMSLERLARKAGDPEALEQLLERLAEAVTTPEHKLMVFLDLAELREGKGDVESALDAVAAAAALGADPERVASRRLRLCELAGDPDRLIEALDAEIASLSRAAASETRDPSDSARSAMLRRRQARLLQGLISERPDERDALLEKAWDILQEARSAAPEQPLLLADLIEVAEGLGKSDELALLYATWEAREGDSERSLGLALHRAEALLGSGKRDEAVGLLQELSRRAPGYLPIVALCERDALATGDWAALAAAYMQAAGAAATGTAFVPLAGAAAGPGDATWAASLYVSAGELYAVELGDLVAARDAHERALAVVPGYGPAVEALCDVLLQAGEPERAAEVLAAEVAAGRTGERTAHVLERLGRLYEDRGDHERALAAHRERLDAVALREGPGSARAERVRWRMEAALAGLGRTGERVDLLVEIAGHTDDPGRRGSALHRAARLCELAQGEIQDGPARAADLYRDVLTVWPGDRYARAALSALLRRAGRWDELLAELLAEAEELADGPSLARALREAAGLLERELGRPEDALAMYRSLLDRMPGHPGVLRGMAEVLESRDRSGTAEVLADLIEVYELESTADEPEEARAPAVLRLARAHERAGRPDDALEAYRRAADMAPGSALATVAMVELAGDDDLALIDALGQLARDGRSDRVQSELMEEMGWLWAGAAGDVGRALDAFDEAARASRDGDDASPVRPGPLLGKLLLHARENDIPAVGEALFRLGGAISAPRVGAAVMLRAAAIAESEGRSDAVNERLYQALSHAPADQATLMLAAEYALAARPDEEVSPEQLVGRAQLFALRARLAGNLKSRSDWNLCCAEALEGAGRLREAAQSALKVLEAEPDHARALTLLGRVCERGGDVSGWAQARLGLAAVVREPTRRCELLREAATAVDRTLGKPEEAAAIYGRILELDPGAPELDRLAEICRELGDVRTLFDALSARLDWLEGQKSADPDARAVQVPLYFERATLRRGFGDTAGAVRDLAAVLDIDPGHTAALWAQGQALIAAGQAGAAVALIERYCELESDAARRGRAELALAEVLAGTLDDGAGAIVRLGNVLAQWPEGIAGDGEDSAVDGMAVRERLVELLVLAEDWQRAAGELGELAARRSTPAMTARDELRRAEIFVQKLGDKDAARDALKRARKLDPVNIEVAGALADVTGEGLPERYKVFAAAAGDLQAAIAERPGDVALYERLATVFAWLSDRDGEAQALAAVKALGELSKDKAAVLAARAASRAKGRAPEKNLSDSDWDELRAVGSDGDSAVAEVWRALAEAVDKSLDRDPGKLGFARGDKVSSRSLGKHHAPLAAVVDCFGLQGAEFYVSSSKSDYAQALHPGKAGVCLSADVAEADTAKSRFLLGRAIAWAREGTGALAGMDERDVELWLAAAVQVVGLSPVPEALEAVFARDRDAVEERGKELSKHLGWLDKRGLGQVIERVGARMGSPAAWRRAALATAERAGLLLAGGVVDPAVQGELRPDRAELEAHLSWLVSRQHLELCRQLGITAKDKARE